MARSSDSELLTSCVGTTVIVIAALILATFMNGWVLSLLWKWFIVPIFKLPMLTVIQAIGIFMTVNFLTVHLQNEITETKTVSDLASVFIGKVLVYPLMVAGIGWLISGLV
jgi:hypothetical protein